MADKKEGNVERIYTVNLSKAYEYVRTKRAGRAVKILREYLARHFKVAGADVSLSNGVNSRIWRDSIQKPPRKLKVRAVKGEGVVKVFIAGVEERGAKVPAIKKRGGKEKKKVPKKEESPPSDAKKEEKK